MIEKCGICIHYSQIQGIYGECGSDKKEDNDRTVFATDVGCNAFIDKTKGKGNVKPFPTISSDSLAMAPRDHTGLPLFSQMLETLNKRGLTMGGALNMMVGPGHEDAPVVEEKKEEPLNPIFKAVKKQSKQKVIYLADHVKENK